LWDELKRRLNSYEAVPTSMHVLWESMQVEWERITKQVCVNLIDSIPRRIVAVLKAKGGNTKY